MTPTEAALIGASIGAATALIASVLSNWIALRNEGRRLDEARRAADTQVEEARLKAYTQELTAQTAQAFKKMFEILHAIMWITAHVVIDPKLLTVEMISSYDSKVEKTYPELLGSLAVVAGLSLDIYGELRGFAERINSLEKPVAEALLRLKLSKFKDAQAIASLRESNAHADQLYANLPPELARVIEQANVYGLRRK